MDQDETTELLQRAAVLGFKPQKENVYNKLLPYSEELDKESLLMLKSIKENLSKAVIMRELRPGCGIWVARLTKYIKFYGYKFSKEDHIFFIRLMYELVTIPNLEPWLVNKFAPVLTTLLKKKELISPEDLEIPWRPLYQLCTRFLNSNHGPMGMFRYITFIENNLDSLVTAALFYFPLSATAEILEELRPQLCPVTYTLTNSAMDMLNRFLPTALPADKSAFGYELWFNELMGYWDTCLNFQAWEHDMLWLMANLAYYNIGYIDWEPYIPMMFSRFLRSFNLPVFYKQTSAMRVAKLDTSPMALWIVSVIGGGSSAQNHLDKLMCTLESYYHPANTGRWLMKLKTFLKKLPSYFATRVYNERYRKRISWLDRTPESHRLTDEDIRRFVVSMKPVALQAIYGRSGLSEVAHALHYLATLRPDIIIPEIVERLYTVLDTLTEPHKMTAMMQCLTAVARPLVQGAHEPFVYPEGVTHVIPLLKSVLPGIDANDIRKSFITFQFLAMFSMLVPLVDCSHAHEHWPDLTEEERDICSATAELEDFVLAFLDRCFILVESSTLEMTRMEHDGEKRSMIENMAETALLSTCTTLLLQTSQDIFKAALKKLSSFLNGKILETKVSGQFIATIARAFSKVNPEETLKVLLPPFCDNILSLTEQPEVQKEENLDNELLFNLLIVASLVECNEEALSPHMDRLCRVLDRTMHLTCREGYMLASRCLRNLMHGLCFIFPKEYRCVPVPYDTPVKDFLYIRNWAKSCDLNSLKFEWNFPTPKSILLAQHMFNKYCTPELERIEAYINQTLILTREELQRTLRIILSLLNCKILLPVWDEPSLILNDSVIDNLPFSVKSASNFGSIMMKDGSNIRKSLSIIMDKLQKKMLIDCQDDIKSMSLLIDIWEYLLLNKDPAGGHEMRYKNFIMVKKLLENKLLGSKKHVRGLLIDRIGLQHETLLEYSSFPLTQTHKDIMLNLLTLATSFYSEVRIRAQKKLNVALEQFSFSYTVLMPALFENLTLDSTEHHERLKGSLYILLGPKSNPIITRHNWATIHRLWPAIVRIKPSEKLSVIRLLDTLVETVHKQFPTITITVEVPDECITAAYRLLGTNFDEELNESSKKTLEAHCLQNRENYNALIENLLESIHKGQLHWRFQEMTIAFLHTAVHPEIPYSVSAAKYFLNTLLHDSLSLRKVALRCLVFVLAHQKRKHKTIIVDPTVVSGTSISEHISPGPRPDNLWMQYSYENRPLTAEQWNQPKFIYKPSLGYYCWPKELKMYASNSEQPNLHRDPSELNPVELEIYNFFSNQENIDKLITYFSLEEKKGKDKFNSFRFLLFKSLFRNHGDIFLKYFKHHILRLVADKQESSQRCASEIIAGIIRGSKHWTFEMTSELWEFLTPVIRTAQTNMTVETVADWGVCFATASEHRDPNRIYWLLELLMEEPLRDEASFIECGRIYTLQGALNQMSWRVPELYVRLINYLKPYLTHSFQNVRERLGSCLTTIFEPDLILPDGNPTNSPHVNEFLDELMPQLQVLYNYQNSLKISKTEIPNITEQINQLVIDPNEKDKAIRLFKTVCRWIIGALIRTAYGSNISYYRILPLVCMLESYEADEELGKTCTSLLATLSCVSILDKYIPDLINAIKITCKEASWSARVSALEFLQVAIFHNMPLITQKKEWKDEVTHLVLSHLEDEWVDVRVKAGQVLGGLLHCDFFENSLELLEKFKLKSRTKLHKRRIGARNGFSPNVVESIKVRHSAILGLCAFINAQPYQVPNYIPDVFEILGNHLNDPQPIPATIRKTLGDFKRTHHDNWSEHSLKFTEEQLAILGDLTIPPSYYA